MLPGPVRVVVPTSAHGTPRAVEDVPPVVDPGSRSGARRCLSTSTKKTVELCRWLPLARASTVWRFRPRKENVPPGCRQILFVLFLSLPHETIIVIVLYKAVSIG